MKTKENCLYVYSNQENIDYFVGTLKFYKNDKEEYQTFEYSDEWLNNKNNYSLGIDLPLKSGVFECHDNDQDRTFRNFSVSYVTGEIDFYFEYLLLYAQKHNKLITYENFDEQEIHSWLKKADDLDAKYCSKGKCDINMKDNFIFSNDYTRSGSLRFKEDKDGEFLQTLDNEQLPTIENIDKIIEINDKIKNHEQTDEETEIFHTCVSGLGGRKTKTTVKDKKGNLYIAKLNCVNNLTFVGIGLEILAIRLAKKFGIKTQECSMATLKNGQQFMLIKRFDRNKGKRIPFIKLNAFIKFNGDYSQSSLKNAIILASGKNANKNFKEFFKRRLFRLAIGDSGGHFPNTGFILDKNGWKFSPEYDTRCGYEYYKTVVDINNYQPSYIKGRKKKIQELFDNRAIFGVSKIEAKNILKKIKLALKNWEKEAKKIGFDDEQIFRIKIYKKSFNYIKIK